MTTPDTRSNVLRDTIAGLTLIVVLAHALYTFTRGADRPAPAIGRDWTPARILPNEPEAVVRPRNLVR